MKCKFSKTVGKCDVGTLMPGFDSDGEPICSQCLAGKILDSLKEMLKTSQGLFNFSEEFEGFENNNPYDFINRLGRRFFRSYNITKETNFEEINNIYGELMKLLHPDVNPHINPEISKRLNAMFDKIKNEKGRKA